MSIDAIPARLDGGWLYDQRICSRCLKPQTGPTYSVAYGSIPAQRPNRGCFMHVCCPSCLWAWAQEAGTEYTRRWVWLEVRPNEPMKSKCPGGSLPCDAMLLGCGACYIHCLCNGEEHGR